MSVLMGVHIHTFHCWVPAFRDGAGGSLLLRFWEFMKLDLLISQGGVFSSKTALELEQGFRV